MVLVAMVFVATVLVFAVWFMMGMVCEDRLRDGACGRGTCDERDVRRNCVSIKSSSVIQG